MATNTIVPVSTTVTGDITICKIETAATRVDRDGPFSLFETTTYQSYDVCTKDVIDVYLYQTLTPFAVGMALMALLAIPIAAVFMLALSESRSTYY